MIQWFVWLKRWFVYVPCSAVCTYTRIHRKRIRTRATSFVSTELKYTLCDYRLTFKQCSSPAIRANRGISDLYIKKGKKSSLKSINLCWRRIDENVKCGRKRSFIWFRISFSFFSSRRSYIGFLSFFLLSPLKCLGFFPYFFCVSECGDRFFTILMHENCKCQNLLVILFDVCTCTCT